MVRVRERSLRVGGCAGLEFIVEVDGFEDAVRVVKERFFDAVTEVVRRGYRMVETIADSSNANVHFDRVSMGLHITKEGHNEMYVSVSITTEDPDDITELVKIMEEKLKLGG